VLTTANAAGTNALTCLPNHGEILVTHSMTNLSERCLASASALTAGLLIEYRDYLTFIRANSLITTNSAFDDCLYHYGYYTQRLLITLLIDRLKEQQDKTRTLYVSK
jgi:hypothetical protein